MAYGGHASRDIFTADTQTRSFHVASVFNRNPKIAGEFQNKKFETSNVSVVTKYSLHATAIKFIG